jgi:hypothetical protein
MVWASSDKPTVVGRDADRSAGHRFEKEKEGFDELDRAGEVV